jgi:hypothetical protein
MCSRVLGLAREQIFAALFGGGAMMDAFTIAFRIPNLLRDLFAEGALSTAFITIFSKRCGCIPLGEQGHDPDAGGAQQHHGPGDHLRPLDHFRIGAGI